MAPTEEKGPKGRKYTTKVLQLYIIQPYSYKRGDRMKKKKYTYYERGKSFVDDLHNENDSIK